jgi:hypothetical protein
MPRGGRWQGHEAAWNLGKNRSYAKRRRERPSLLVSRLRAVVAKVGLEVIGYEYEVGPRPWWIDIWVRLPGGQEGGLDVIWDSMRPVSDRDAARQQDKERWLAGTSHPYLFIRERASVAMEMRVRTWVRRVRMEAARPSDPRPPSAGAADS